MVRVNKRIIRKINFEIKLLDKKKFYINGKWVEPVNKNECEVINPADETPFAVTSCVF